MRLQPLAPPDVSIRDESLSAPRKPAVAGPTIFFVAHNASNVVNYAFLLVMSQAFKPADFALFAAPFGVIYLASALANTVQTSIASAVASVTGDSGNAIVGVMLRRMLLLGVPLATITALAARPIATYLHSDDVMPMLVTGVALWLFLLAAVGYGAQQGSSRFDLLGGGVLVASVGRLVFGILFLWLGLGVTGALLGVAVGLLLSAAVVTTPYAKYVSRPISIRLPPASMALAPALLVSIAIAIPTSADVFLVQHYLGGLQAGSYAAVSVLGKVIIFGPLAISLIYFPKMVREHTAARSMSGTLAKALLATSAGALPLMATVTFVSVFAPDIALRGYEASIGFILTYLGAMLAFSLVIPLLYYNLARRSGPFAWMVLAGLLCEIAVILLRHTSAFEISAIILIGNVTLLTVGLVLAFYQLRRTGGEEAGRS